MADFIQGDYEYTIISGTTNVGAKVVDESKSSYENIPSTVVNEGITYTVTSLDSCFSGCDSLTIAPTIPDSVTNMSKCFTACHSLTTVPKISDNAIDMSYCFNGCTLLTTVPAIPDGVTTLAYCFTACDSLITAPIIPDSVTDMWTCFNGCDSLTTVPRIPNNVRTMRNCFSSCSSLTTVPAIPDSVTDMLYCFRDCHSLTTVPKISNSVTDLNRCFAGCTSLTTAPAIPDGVLYMYYCFSGCTSLTTAPDIPDSVTNMLYCFDGCSSLTTVPAIPDSVTSMYACFNACTALTTVPKISNNVTDLSHCFYNCTSLVTAPTIPDGVTNLEYCFYKCTALTIAPTIPDGVTNMQDCFFGCTYLTTPPDIPDSVTNMSYCFGDCKNLYYAKPIPANVTNVRGCFYGCTYLRDTVAVFNNPTTYDNVFTNTSGSIQIAVIGQNQSSAINTWTTIANQRNNVSMWSASNVIAYIGDYQYTVETNGMSVKVVSYSQQKSKLSEIIAPLYINNTAYNIIKLNYCFQSCVNLIESPKIPDTVLRMYGCFKGCEKLKQSPVIPDIVCNMSCCFEDCYELTGIIRLNNSLWDIESDYNVFINTVKPIYLINEGSANVSDWTNVASQYNNVYLSSIFNDYMVYALTSSTAKLIPYNKTQCSYLNFSTFATVSFWGNTYNITDVSLEDCENLIISPVIPSFITNMDNCFLNCTNLRNIIKVYNSPTNYDDIFVGTVNPIIIVDCNATPSTTWQTIANTYDNVTYSQLQTAYVDMKRLGNSVILSNLSETNDSQSTKTKVYVSGIDFTNIPDDWQSYIVEFAV